MTGLEYALAYEQLGYSVVPIHAPVGAGCSCPKRLRCPSPGKHPRIDWKPFQRQRATSEEIREWFAEWGEGQINIGIITGMISGLCVLDIDHRNGGFETLVELDARKFCMPEDNPVVITGSGGMHHYFALEAAMPKAAPFEGIDVQADGALVVAPPSRHASGRVYRWARAMTAPKPPLPSWVRFAVEKTTAPISLEPVPPLETAGDDDVLGALHHAGLCLGRHRRPGVHRIRCPWAAEHSNEDGEAVVIEPGASRAPGWAFVCLHAHCASRTIGDLLDHLAIPRRRA